MTDIHPIIDKLARWVQQQGHRITSIVRPGISAHAKGFAFDVAPWKFSKGWGDRRRAREFHELLRPLSEGHPLMVVGEGAHIHAELSEDDFTGNIADWWSEKGKGVEMRNDRPDYDMAESGAPELAWGVSAEGGFGASGAIQGFPWAMAAGGPGGMVQARPQPMKMGALHVSRLQGMIRPAILINQLAAGKESAVQKFAQLRLADPPAAREIQGAMIDKMLTLHQHIGYTAFKGGSITADNLGPNAVLRPSEVDSLRISLSAGSVFEPRVFPFTEGAVPGDWYFDLATTLNAIGAAKWPANGVIVNLSASYFNMTPGAPFSISFTTDGRLTRQLTCLFAHNKVKAAQMLILNGVLSGGKPRFVTDLVAAGSVYPNGLFEVNITGLPTNYTPTARLLQYGENETEQFIGLTD